MKAMHNFLRQAMGCEYLLRSCTPVFVDVDECTKENNRGGCDSKRECTNMAGSVKCGDCASGWANDGEKGCKGSCLLVNWSAWSVSFGREILKFSMLDIHTGCEVTLLSTRTHLCA